jgi:hypothetical protein
MRFSARDREDLELLAEEVDAMPLLRLEPRAVPRALDAQMQLATLPDVSHRVKPDRRAGDCGREQHDSAVLHNDSDHELL